MYTGFWGGNLRERVHLEDPGVGGMKILGWILHESGSGCMYWIELAQDRDRWRAFVNAVLKLEVP